MFVFTFYAVDLVEIQGRVFLLNNAATVTLDVINGAQ